MPCWARQPLTHCSGQPSRARMRRPELALLTRDGARPPTPAMQDISAKPWRSRRRARVLANWATLEQPEQEYTSGSVWSGIFAPSKPFNWLQFGDWAASMTLTEVKVAADLAAI